MAAATYYGFEGPAVIRRYPVAASQTFKKGHPLTLSSGKVAALVAAGSAATTEKIAGFANEDALDANGVLKTDIAVILPQPGVAFEMAIYHATPASAVAAPATQLGTSYEVTHVTTNDWYGITIAATTNDKVRIVGYRTDTLPTWPGATTAGTVQYPVCLVECVVGETLLSGAS